jgi:nucleoid DNA-binding protein
MNELIERLKTDAGLTPEQAAKAIETITNFVKEKFPMLGGAVDNIFSAGQAD